MNIEIGDNAGCLLFVALVILALIVLPVKILVILGVVIFFFLMLGMLG